MSIFEWLLLVIKWKNSVFCVLKFFIIERDIDLSGKLIKKIAVRPQMNYL